jgi:regulator of protease activity HflC (stomatin/prohibitin superfamily)
MLKGVIIAILVIIFMVAGCQLQNNTEDLSGIATYEIDDGLHVIIGFGQWIDESFHIQSVNGQEWDIPSSVKITRSEVTPEDIKRQTK